MAFKERRKSHELGPSASRYFGAVNCAKIEEKAQLKIGFNRPASVLRCRHNRNGPWNVDTVQFGMLSTKRITWLLCAFVFECHTSIIAREYLYLVNTLAIYTCELFFWWKATAAWVGLLHTPWKFLFYFWERCAFCKASKLFGSFRDKQLWETCTISHPLNLKDFAQMLISKNFECPCYMPQTWTKRNWMCFANTGTILFTQKFYFQKN